ncbi:kinase-like domain-containing protein [Rhizophagus clarus]|uniref:Kinase-like domain-containing protein n=1 Tax=Rhizophagus clarus TaxID=94130 RepID=A0A8H3KZ67_9GLOM|nr:kinase-like domain-containing protein [Rhizophagus clarus]
MYTVLEFYYGKFQVDTDLFMMLIMVCLMLSILNGKREKIVDETPVQYSKLYTECWKYEINERPNMQEIVLIFKASILPEIIIYNTHEDKKYSFSLEEYNKPNLESIQSIVSEKVSLSSIDLIDSIYSVVAEKLINYIIDKHDKGITFDQIQQLIDKKILQLNQNLNDLIDWLSKNQDKPKYIWFLGLFYYYNLDTRTNNSVKAFELFLKAANDNYSIAQYFIGVKKSANNGSIIGKFNLGYCYEFGIGILGNEKESAYWYNEASKGRNTTAKLYLANCYKLGKGVDKDEVKAFKYYEILAKQEISDA